MDELAREVPPPPDRTPSLLPVFVETGARYRLAYVSGFGDDRYEVSDTATGEVERFPLTAGGWDDAWRTWAARESGATPAPATVEEAGRPPRRRKRLLGGVGTLTTLGIVALVGWSWLRPAPALPFEDDFSSEGAWEVGEDEGGALGYEDGAYRISVPGDDDELLSYAYWDGTSDTIAVEADARLVEGSAALSLICLSEVGPEGETSDQDRYYDFYVLPREGRYGILASDGETHELGHGEQPNLLDAEGVNRIGIECHGGGGPARLKLRVNGRLVLERTHLEGFDDFRGIALGLYGIGGAATALFDNVSAVEP